jgi:hypothetical protein
VIVWLSLVSPAPACSPAGSRALVEAPDPTDVVAPAPPIVGEPIVDRPSGSGGACGGLASLVIPVERPDGDPDPEETVGYRLALVDGALPAGLDLPDDPLVGPRILLVWSDRASEDPFELTLSLTAVDAAGNEGDPVEIEVTDPGVVPFDEPVGCDSTGRTGWLGLGLLAPLAVRRRR